MKRRVSTIFALMLAVVMILACSIVASAEETTERTATRYNVVMTIDGSGSLTMKNGTDTQGYRYDAIELFLGVLTNDGNKVGAIVFNDKTQMPLDTGLKELNSMAAKQDFAALIEKTGARGDTDIGSALQRALVELQGPDANKELPSCILLFSDGETDMGSQKATQVSLGKKEEAVKEAKRLGIPIHGICLNTNNSANSQEVKGIAENTGGIYIEIKDASDLDDAFLQFYSLIYNEQIIGEELECPVVRNFKIPSTGVVEVNIIVEATGADKVITLTRPNGIAYSEAELSAASMNTGGFDIIKITNPESGVWALKVDGAPGAKVYLDWIYNTDLAAEIECDATEATLNTDVVVKGYLLSKNARVEDATVYNEYTGTLILTNKATGESKNYPMTADGSSFVTNVQFSEYGTYNAVIQLVCGDITHTSETTQINVGNKPPVVKQSIVEETITAFLFKPAKANFDLSDYFSDPEGDALTYELGTYSYDADKVELKDGNLKVNAKGQNKGKVVVIATDSQGATSEITINIKVRNLTTLLLIVLAVIILIVVVILVMNYKAKISQVCPWTITVSSFDNNSGMSTPPYPQSGFKYKKNLRDWQISECGINGEFLAERVKGRKQGNLKFISKQPFETEGGQIVKEYKFMLGDDIRLFAPAVSEDDRNSRGIRVIVTDSMDW